MSTLRNGLIALVLATAGCTPMDDAANPSGITVAPETGVATSPTSLVPASNPPPNVTPCEPFTPNDQLPLKRCDRGELVSRLQGELATVLGIDLAPDGYFGDRTEQAVLDYQESTGLVADGLAGTATWNALFGSSLTTDDSTRGISENWFARPASEAVPALEAQGFLVSAYEVCSSSVDEGEVRQILGSDGTVYVDKNGVTADASDVSIGSVIEVKIGNGTAC